MSRSPFTPGYGVQPLVFGGHAGELAGFRHAFEEYDFGDRRSVLLSGLRGAGKTSMLAMLRSLAVEAGWLVIADNATKGMLDRISNSHLPGLVNQLTDTERTVLTGLGFGQFKADVDVRDERRPVTPLLRNDLIAISKARDGRGILITIDEVATGLTDKSDLRTLAMEIAHAAESANIVAAFAGIKLDLEAMVNQDHLTFLRRSRNIDFRRLSVPETTRVLVETARIGGRGIDDDALPEMLRVSQGYPYLVQLVGDEAWRQNPDAPTISVADARVASRTALAAVFDRVISRAYDDLSPRDRDFVRALAELGDRAKMADISEVVRTHVRERGEDDAVITPQYANSYRNRLIDSGYVESSGHGYVQFSLPYLGDYVRRMVTDEAGGAVDEGPAGSEWDAHPPPRLP